METGSIRRLQGDSSRFLASRESPVLVGRIGTAFPGPALTSGPGAFSSNYGFIDYAAARNDPVLSSPSFLFHALDVRWPGARRKS